MTNLPFHSSGKSSSKWISGPITPATLQCGTPSVSCVTDEMVTSGNCGSDSRLHACSAFCGVRFWPMLQPDKNAACSAMVKRASDKIPYFIMFLIDIYPFYLMRSSIYCGLVATRIYSDLLRLLPVWLNYRYHHSWLSCQVNPAMQFLQTTLIYWQLN